MRHGCQVLYGCLKVRVLPDYGEIVIFLYGIQSIKLENLLDSLERQATQSGGVMVNAWTVGWISPLIKEVSQTLQVRILS